MFLFLLLIGIILLICWYIIKDSNKPLSQRVNTKIDAAYDKVVDALDINDDGALSVKDAKELVTKGKIVANKVVTQVNKKTNKKRNHPK